ncbi:MAG: molybdate ABC transporter substrate-binding protein [Phormidesmis sp.]
MTITVSAAASLQDALEAIAPQFSTAYPNIAVDYNFGASGALQRQIEQGAPVDVFFSAATKQMDALADKALILPSSRQNLLTNRLVLIAPTASNLNITNLSQLKDTDISRFAVGEFRSVPAGQYAEQVFQKLDFLDALQSKFVFGNNVRSVLSAVESGNADLGMVYATDAALSERVKVILTVPADAHSPITYPIAVVQSSPRPEAAQTFINFLTTEPAQAIFQAFGFGQS